MARKNVAKIPFEKFEKIANQLGMVIVSKGAETKIFAPGTDAAKTVRKACIAVPNTKLVTRVEIVNFESEFAVPHPKPSAKTVTGMINFEQDAKMVLNHTYKTCKAICAAAKAEAEKPAVTEVVEPVVTEAPVEAPVAEAVGAEVAVG
jgi:hypothetical protein